MADERLPDFIIGGAPRSGTTYLYELLDLHPGVYMAKPPRPEPKFFLVDEHYARGLAHYARTWFAAAPRDRKAGEKSTNYLESAFCAERIGRDLPRIKLVFILREPVSRAFSNYLWSRQNGHEAESFERAMALEEERERSCPVPLRFARPHAYFARGLYAELLRPWFDRFPREQILVLPYEDIAARPEALAARLHGFLGVAPRPEDARNLGVVNASRNEEGEAVPENLRAKLAGRFAEPNRRLAALLGPDAPGWATP
jgi:hypothetical protein